LLETENRLNLNDFPIVEWHWRGVIVVIIVCAGLLGGTQKEEKKTEIQNLFPMK
jgi:hypothetical protein